MLSDSFADPIRQYSSTPVFQLMICNAAIRQEVRFLKNSIVKKAYKALDLGLGPGVNRFKNGAYTSVREYFESIHNTAIGQEMRLYKPFFGRVMVNVLPRPNSLATVISPPWALAMVWAKLSPSPIPAAERLGSQR